VFLASVAFVLGFTVVFVALGASASTVGLLLNEYLWLLTKIAGVLVILFGLHTMGVLKIGALYRQAQIDVKRKPAGPLGAFVVGLAFAFGWTPCIGPILGSMLALAAREESVSQGAFLLSVYSLGLGVPFLATSLAVNRFFAAFRRVRKYYRMIEIVAGLLMVVIGVLLVLDRFSLIVRALQPYLPTF
jgi:cytochrome c-type biogenesis protein